MKKEKKTNVMKKRKKRILFKKKKSFPPLFSLISLFRVNGTFFSCFVLNGIVNNGEIGDWEWLKFFSIVFFSFFKKVHVPSFFFFSEDDGDDLLAR